MTATRPVIAILDPALLWRAPGEHVDALEQAMRLALQICVRIDARVPMLEEYWRDLWLELGAPLERASLPAQRRAIQEVRKLGKPADDFPPLRTPTGRVYGLRQLFTIGGTPDPWCERMTNALARATATGARVVLLARRIVGRDLVLHSAGHSQLLESRRWVLQLHLQGRPPAQVSCLHHPRNWDLPWTTRFDWRLPAVQDGATHPFCPPQHWWKASTSAVSTMESRTVWLDAHGRGWARPNTPGSGHHWDVYLREPALVDRVGLSQLNIIEFGDPSEGRAGHLHHVPSAKKGRLKSRVGWPC